MELRNTVDDMLSRDYKRRFRAEYNQTKIRYEKLHRIVIQSEAGTLPFSPTCQLSLLRDQKSAMGEYLHTLEVRAEIEKIDLYAPSDAMLDAQKAAQSAVCAREAKTVLL